MDSGRLEAVPQGSVHLDTVRALHQTVVSLRTALEVSKNELKELRDKYTQHSQCNNYADVIEKLTLENHVLRRKIIDSGYVFEDKASNISPQNIKLQVTYSPYEIPEKQSEEFSETDIVLKTASPEINIESEVLEIVDDESEYVSEVPQEFCTVETVNYSYEVDPDVENIETTLQSDGSQVEEPCSQVSLSKQEIKASASHPSFKTKLELLSKFDVTIKVQTVKDGVLTSSTTSDTESTLGDKGKEDLENESQQNFCFEENREHFNDTKDLRGHIEVKTFSTENIKMAVPSEAESKGKNDKFDVQVRITSEENLVVRDVSERHRRKDTLNLDVDDLSLRSMSEGDNSVFSEGAMTPVDPSGVESEMTDDKHIDQENASGNESEEVDDIELIFTTDESKDMSNLQEDLVSIRESDWGPSPTSTTHSTPVLIKFHTLDPDFQPRSGTRDNTQNVNQENTNVPTDSSLKVKRVSLPNDKEIKQVAFNKSANLPGRPGILKSGDNKYENILFKRSPNTSTRRLDSVDSLSCEYTRGLSFDNTKSSSFELGSSMDILNREESLDSFHRNAHLGHRFSVFAETDISKCGISEEDLASANLNLRRNTCPNPFQYRPLATRGFSRTPGPFKATLTPTVGRTRPILRPDNYSVRRENGAQTEVSALPNRWSSDGYLAHKVGVSAMSVLPSALPSRAPAVTSGRRLTVTEARPSLATAGRRPEDTRRVLLSDIGFTSMVPELSRSADPVWAAVARRPTCASCGAPAGGHAASTTKYLSRGSTYRSPCLSVDRSSDWTPHANTTIKEQRVWRSSLPDVRRDDTDDLLEEAEVFLRRSIDNLRSTSIETEGEPCNLSRPYIPAEPRHLRLGHSVKVITPQGRIAVGRVRYVGLAGSNASDSCIMVGAIFPLSSYPWIPLNDGTHRGRRYFHAPPQHTALFVSFTKVVMAWAN